MLCVPTDLFVRVIAITLMRNPDWGLWWCGLKVSVLYLEAVILNTHARQAQDVMLKGMTCLASEFEKCQKSVYKQDTSLSSTSFSWLTSPCCSQRNWDDSLRISDLQRSLWRTPVHQCLLSKEAGEVKLSITAYPFKGVALSLCLLQLHWRRKPRDCL